MRRHVARLLGQAFHSRVVYALVVFNLCFVAFLLGQTPSEGHGAASCVAPPPESDPYTISICSFSPPPPVWLVAGVVSNAPPVLVSAYLSESLEARFPALCGLMTFLNLSTLAAGICLQWAIVGLGAVALIKRARAKLGGR